MIWPVRAALLALLCASLVLRLASTRADAAPPDPAPRLAAALQGREVGAAVEDNDPHGLRVFTLRVAGCRGPVRAALTLPSFVVVPVFASTTAPGDRIAFAYLDWRSDRPDRLAVLRRRAVQTAAALVRASPYRDPRTLLLLAEDRDCRAIEAADWRRFWLTPPR